MFGVTVTIGDEERVIITLTSTVGDEERVLTLILTI